MSANPTVHAPLSTALQEGLHFYVPAGEQGHDVSFTSALLKCSHFELQRKAAGQIPILDYLIHVKQVARLQLLLLDWSLISTAVEEHSDWSEEKSKFLKFNIRISTRGF